MRYAALPEDPHISVRHMPTSSMLCTAANVQSGRIEESTACACTVHMQPNHAASSCSQKQARILPAGSKKMRKHTLIATPVNQQAINNHHKVAECPARQLTSNLSEAARTIAAQQLQRQHAHLRCGSKLRYLSAQAACVASHMPACTTTATVKEHPLALHTCTLHTSRTTTAPTFSKRQQALSPHQQQMLVCCMTE
jgi:hypothetical protein